MFAEKAVGERVGLGPAVQFDAEGAARQGEDEMPVQFGRGVRRDDRAVLLGQCGNAQRLGKAGGARRIELNEPDAALDNEIPDGKAGQLALAMRERDRRGRGQPGEIGRLQIPMQRLLKPEDPMRLDGTSEIDALRQIVGRVHVEHQQRSRRRSPGAPRRYAPPPAKRCRLRS